MVNHDRLVYSAAMIKEGRKAPALALAASTGDTVKLSAYAGSIVVLYFYPRDNTPGCTTEAKEFSAALPALKRLGAVVFGVSKDTVESHCKFIDKQKLKIPLLSDPDGKVIEKYGAWGEKSLYGKKSMGIIRSTVIIGADGKVKKHYPKVRLKGHVDDVVESVRAIAKAAKAD